jgi:uncharacterized protein HemY
MQNLALAILVGLATFAALYVPRLLSVGEAIVPAVLATVIAYFLLARRTFKAVEAIFNTAAQSLQATPPRFDLAISQLQSASRYSKIQIGVRTQIDSQIGVLYFLQQQYNEAMPYLKSSLGFGHWIGGAMLAVVYYKKKQLDDMKATLEVVTKRGKKQGLAWCLRAYLLMQLNERDAAMSVLAEGLKATKDDPKVKEALIAVQNGKKIKMRSWKEQWYQFHLERPPAQYAPAPVGGRISRIARRGRW